jgi:hypothetical protein
LLLPAAEAVEVLDLDQVEAQAEAWLVLTARPVRVQEAWVVLSLMEDWAELTTVKELQVPPVTGELEAPEAMAHSTAVAVEAADTTAAAVEARMKILVALMPVAVEAVPHTPTQG